MADSIKNYRHCDDEPSKSFFLIKNLTQLTLTTVMVGAVTGANAFEISTGNPDLNVNLDTTARYTLGVRAESQDKKILNNPVYGADSDALFKRGDLVANRLDLLTEFVVTYKREMGARVSAAGWVDEAYSRGPQNALGNDTPYFGNNWSPTADRYYKGPSGEILDAFVFGKIDVGPVPVNVKAGRHTNYWGESLFAAHTGVNYGQAPVDIRKALANPGSEAKELFFPMNQVSAQAQLTDTVSLSSYYGLEWRADRIPDGGTYLGDVAFLFQGPDKFPLIGATRLDPLKGRNSGDFGISFKWRPENLDGVLGFYYRKFDEKLPWVQFGVNGQNAYREVFARGTELYGVSLNKVFGGVSVGTELAYRKDTALLSTGVSGEDNQGARGNTLHGLVNAIALLNKSPMWDSAVLLGELTWTHRLSVSKHAELAQIDGNIGCAGKDKWDGCTTKDAFAVNLAFTPTWTQVFPSIDLSLPITYGIGLKGNGATPGSSNQGAGSYSIGLSAAYQGNTTVTLKYNDYLVKYRDDGNVVTSFNGQSPALLSDRGWVSLTLKTSF